MLATREFSKRFLTYTSTSKEVTRRCKDLEDDAFETDSANIALVSEIGTCFLLPPLRRCRFPDAVTHEGRQEPKRLPFAVDMPVSDPGATEISQDFTTLLLGDDARFPILRTRGFFALPIFYSRTNQTTMIKQPRFCRYLHQYENNSFTPTTSIGRMIL